MIWVNFVKRFLGAVAAQDFEAAADFLGNGCVLEFFGVQFTGSQGIIQRLSSAGFYNLSVLNTAYNNKLIFLELESYLQCISCDTYCRCVCVATINEYGKISRMSFYRGS